MIRRYQMPLPENGPDQSYDVAAHRTAFVAFLRFLKGNLAGQTAIRVDAAWCTQAQAIMGFGEFCPPDRIIREDDLAHELADLAKAVGKTDVPAVPAASPDHPFGLQDIYDEEIEDLVADAYQRDYVMFGFSRWKP